MIAGKGVKLKTKKKVSDRYLSMLETTICNLKSTTSIFSTQIPLFHVDRPFVVAWDLGVMMIALFTAVQVDARAVRVCGHAHTDLPARLPARRHVRSRAHTLTAHAHHNSARTH